jgi:hypothetical protein
VEQVIMVDMETGTYAVMAAYAIIVLIDYLFLG